MDLLAGSVPINDLLDCLQAVRQPVGTMFVIVTTPSDTAWDCWRGRTIVRGSDPNGGFSLTYRGQHLYWGSPEWRFRVVGFTRICND